MTNQCRRDLTIVAFALSGIVLPGTFFIPDRDLRPKEIIQ